MRVQRLQTEADRIVENWKSGHRETPVGTLLRLESRGSMHKNNGQLFTLAGLQESTRVTD